MTRRDYHKAVKKYIMRRNRHAVTTMIVIFILCSIALFSYSKELPSDTSQKGIIKGRVVDEEVKSPIPLVRVKVIGTPFEALTNENGRFMISDVPVGNFTLELSCHYYVTRLIPDVIVKSKRITHVQIELKLDNSLHEKEEVTVTAGYFSSSEQESSSVTSFSYEEIRRAAGSAGDVSRIISGLPSIARVNDMMNNLVVRGGNPAENAFYIDNIEIPNINHYPVLGSSSGAIGLLNVDFIQDVQFHSGGFSSVYGDRLSSIMDISFRKGNPDEYDYQLDLSMMGLGMVAEGPLPKNKGSWMFSARRSYIDLLIKLMGSGVPVTWSDYQGKLNLDLSPSNHLTFLGIAGVDQSGTEKEDALRDKESYYGSLDTSEYTVGLNWFSMWGSKGYSNTSLSQSHTKYADTSFHTVSEQLAREGTNAEKITSLRNVNTYRFNDANTLKFGIELKHFNTDYNYFLASYTDVMGNPIPDTEKDVRSSANTFAVFASHTWSPVSQLDCHMGIRADYFSNNQHYHFSPRFSLSYKITKKSFLEGTAGIFYQHLPLVLLSQSENHRDLRNPRAYHAILGFRHLLTENTRLSVEVYAKEYDHFPLDPQQPYLFIFDELFYSGFISQHEELIDTGSARSCGIEFMIQKKLADKLYGVISGSYSRTRYQDINGTWRDRIYDNRYIFSVEGGYKFSDTWEFGLKWNYAGSAPYTPFDTEASASVNAGIFDWTRINRERLPDYHSLNLRVDKRFYFGGSNLIVYFSIWNVLNRKNVISYYWNTIEQKPDKFLGWGMLPALGIEFEF